MSAPKDKKQKAANERAEANRTRLLEGAGVGSAAGLALTGAGSILTRGRFNRFQQVADDLKALTQSARKGTFGNRGTADEVAGLVDEADSLRGQPKTFGSNPAEFGVARSPEGVENIVDGGAVKGPFGRAPSQEAKATGREVMSSREASGPDLGENFEKPYSFAGEWGVPALGAADFVTMKGMGAMQDAPEDKQAYDDYANFGLGLGLGAKGSRFISKPFSTLAARGAKTAPVNAAKTKFQRELAEDFNRPAASATPKTPGPSGSPSGNGPQPVRKPPGQGGGLSITALRQRAQQAAQSRAAFHSNGANPNMTKAIAAVQARGARVTADTVMRELKGSLGGSKVDGVSINRRQIGKWLKTHGYLTN